MEILSEKDLKAFNFPKSDLPQIYQMHLHDELKKQFGHKYSFDVVKSDLYVDGKKVFTIGGYTSIVDVINKLNKLGL
jgi:hypothetical protein